MDVREREIIRRNHRLLIQNIILTEEFFDHLKNYHVLPDTMIKDIKVCCSISVRFGLLAIDCDWGAYVKLLAALGSHQIVHWISLYKKKIGRTSYDTDESLYVFTIYEIRVLNCANLKVILVFQFWSLDWHSYCLKMASMPKKHNTNCKFQRKNILFTMALFSMLGH